jgi:hypothetical protein
LTGTPAGIVPCVRVRLGALAGERLEPRPARRDRRHRACDRAGRATLFAEQYGPLHLDPNGLDAVQN